MSINIENELERIKKNDENGCSYWSSRDLCHVLGYSSYQNFEKLINRSISIEKELMPNYTDHFNLKNEMVQVGSGAKRKVWTFYLSRDACKLILDCASSRRDVIVRAKAYFYNNETIEKNANNIISHDEIKRINDLNQRYWEINTRIASQVYINKMGNLAEGLKKHEEMLVGFHRDDTYNGIESPNHIIYKLGEPIISDDGCRAYEFLIEYDIQQPSIGIYYGCKGLTLKGNHEVNIHKFIEDWKSIEKIAALVLSNIFPGKCYNFRFKKTDNADDYTYWPFWITLYDEENIIDVAALAVRTIRRIYELELKKIKHYELSTDEPQGVIPLDKNRYYPDTTNYPKTVSAFNRKAYKSYPDKERKKITPEEVLKILEKEQKYIAPEESYYEANCAWRLQPEISKTDFASFLGNLYREYKISCPWAFFERIILSHDGKSMPDSIRQTNSEGREHKNREKNHRK